jgi:hypothetical protein
VCVCACVCTSLLLTQAGHRGCKLTLLCGRLSVDNANVCPAGAMALTFAVDPRRLKYNLLTSSTDVVHALLGSEQYSPASSCSTTSSTHDQAAVVTASPGEPPTGSKALLCCSHSNAEIECGLPHMQARV